MNEYDNVNQIFFVQTYEQSLVDLAQTCCAGDCPLVTVVSVVPNKRQNTSLVDAVPSTARLRGSKDSLTWTLRRGHGSRTVPWTCD